MQTYRQHNFHKLPLSSGQRWRIWLNSEEEAMAYIYRDGTRLIAVEAGFEHPRDVWAKVITTEDLICIYSWQNGYVLQGDKYKYIAYNVVDLPYLYVDEAVKWEMLDDTTSSGWVQAEVGPLKPEYLYRSPSMNTLDDVLRWRGHGELAEEMEKHIDDIMGDKNVPCRFLIKTIATLMGIQNNESGFEMRVIKDLCDIYEAEEM